MSGTNLRRISLRLALFSGLAFFSFPGLSQSEDSLWSVWSDASQADSIRGNALLAYNNLKYMYKQADSALYLADMIVEFAEQKGLTLLLANGLNTQGQCLMSLGQMDEAKERFDASIDYYREAGMKQGMAGANINVGIIFANTGRGDSAIVRYKKGIALCDEIGEVNFKLNALNNLGVLYLNKGELDSAVPVFAEVVAVSREHTYGSDSHKGGLVNLGYAETKRGNYAQAIEYLNACLELIDEFGGDQVASFAHNFIGGCYMDMGEHENALKHFWQSYELAKKLGEKSDMSSALSNVAGILIEQGDRDKAREYYEQSLNLMTEAGHLTAALQPLKDLALMDLEDGHLDSAEARFSRGLQKAIEMDQTDQQAFMMAGLGGVQQQKGNNAKALEWFSKVYEIGKQLNYLSILQESSKSLSEVHKALGNAQKALDFFEEFVVLRDSAEREENKRATIRQEYRYAYNKQALADSLEFAKKEAVKDLEIQKRDANLVKQRLGLGAAGGGLLLLGLLAYSIRRGKRRSDELLHNILPEEVAAELKAKGHSDAQLFEQTTVLFTDFKGFTSMAEQLSPQALVNDLNVCFSEFDRITSKYGIEKIKTIGDAYMAAGGLPSPDLEHAKHVILAALEMAAFIEEGKRRKIEQGLPYFEIRIGIHTGPVVAGIVGVKKFQYDIWGDTVNTASRLESSGEVGKVNISHSTYELIKDDQDFVFEKRGKIEAKGKGEMEMWFVMRSHS